MAGNASAGTYDDGKTAGSAAAQSALTQFGSRDLANRNISQPMTSPTTLMRTVDGSQSFQANLTAPASAKFLELFIQPAGTGDLQKVMISQDLDTDGAFDYVYNLSRPVSGVCGNGYIACDPATWNHCQYFKWAAGPDGKIADVAASITDLGGCYCINSSCGSTSTCPTRQRKHCGASVAVYRRRAGCRWSSSTLPSVLSAMSMTLCSLPSRVLWPL